VDSAGWDSRYQASELVWGAEPNRFVAAEFTGVAAGRALDVGAGEGRNAVWMATLGWQVTAVDFSAVAIDRGRRLAERQGVAVNWVVADVRDYQPAPAAFDAVIVAYLHLAADDLDVVLRRAAQALALGGRMLVVGHDVTNIAGGVGGPQDPDILYTPEAVVAALPGLTVRTAERVRRPVLTDNAAVDAIDTLVCAVRQ
jgi:SAM-dependent methyltransferase